MTDRSSYQSVTIIAKDHTLDCDTWKTGLNNNMLVLGPTGSGKTRHVLKPNLLQMDASYVVLDTKGTLQHEVGPALAMAGYEVEHIDFAHDMAGNVGYDPLASVRCERDSHGNLVPNYQDILSISEALCPVQNQRDPYWDQAAARLVAALVSLALERAPENCANFNDVMDLYEGLFDGSTKAALERLRATNPRSRALSLYERATAVKEADRTWACIISMVENHLRTLSSPQAREMYDRPDQIDFTRLGQEKIALFVTVSDVDPSLRPLTDLFITQAFNRLIDFADTKCENGMLGVPVRFYLDDFSNLYVPNMADILSVVRSREIWVTLLCQSVEQLKARYGEYDAMSIIANCDTQLVLGFCDEVTAQFYSTRACKTPSTLFASGLDDAWLFVRGRKGEQVRRYDLTEHPRYSMLVES